MALLNEKLKIFHRDRERQYNRTKGILDNLEKEKEESKSVFRIFGKNPSALKDLEQSYEDNLSQLEMIDKKILKMESFLSYCSQHGCLATPKKKSVLEQVVPAVKQNFANILNLKNFTRNN